MDGKEFDALVRRLRNFGTRRVLIQRGLGAATVSALSVLGIDQSDDVAAKKKKIEVCLGGETLTVAKKKKKSFVKKGATIGACPAPPPAPPSPPPPPAICPGQVDVSAACCDNAAATNGQPPDIDNQCASADDVCCSAANGGGFCDPGEKCCPPTEQEPIGPCADSPNAVCCDSDPVVAGAQLVETCCLDGGCTEPGNFRLLRRRWIVLIVGDTCCRSWWLSDRKWDRLLQAEEGGGSCGPAQ